MSAMRCSAVSLILTFAVCPSLAFAQDDEASPLTFAKADETRLGESERDYIGMMLDTIDTAYMSVPSRRDAAEILRRERFLLASPPFASPDTIASVLVGKSPYYRHAIDQFHTDPRYFDFLAACLCIAYANARDEFLAIVAPSVEEMGIWPIPAPRGYMPSVDPEDVVEEDLREEYAERYHAFIRMQSLRNAKQQAGVRLQRVTKSFHTIAGQIKSADDDRVMKHFLETLRKHAGDAAINELFPDKLDHTHATPVFTDPHQATQNNPSLDREFLSDLITRHVVALQSGRSLEEVMADEENRSGLLFQEELAFDGLEVLEAMLDNQAYMASLTDASDSLIQFVVEMVCSSHSRAVKAAQAVVIPDGPRAPRFLAPPPGHAFVVAPERVEDETARAEYETKYRNAEYAEQQWRKKTYLEGRVALSRSLGESTLQLVRRVHKDRADRLIAESLAQASRDTNIDYFEVYKLTSLRDIFLQKLVEPEE